MPTWSCRCRCTGGASCARRFNQSAELGRAVAGLADKPFEPHGGQRASRSRASRSGSASAEREDNVRGAFRVPPERDIDVRGRRVLVVDDVYTTGATVSAVARALKKSGATGGRRADLRPRPAGGLLRRRGRDYIGRQEQTAHGRRDDLHAHDVRLLHGGEAAARQARACTTPSTMRASRRSCGRR